MTGDDFRHFLKTVLPPLGYRWRRFERRNTRRRVRSRMESLGIHETAEYARLVETDPSERSVLDSLLRLTITRFFRNAWLWLDLRSLITELDDVLDEGTVFKVWSAGCAGGEEPFSAAMLLRDLSSAGDFEKRWHILATETDPSALKRSRGAAYAWGSVREVPPNLLVGWFKERDGLWVMDRRIRDSVEFKAHDLVSQEPPGRFHLVLLRNSILTYNTERVQRGVLDKIRRCLLEPGYLVIGRTETLPEKAGFDQVEKCIYRRRE